MKEKTFKILSPIQLAVVAVLDIAVIALGITAIKNILIFASMRNIFFLVCEVIAAIVAVLTTKEIVSHSVIFRDDEFEFTGIDENSLFEYENIESIEAVKDEAPSFVKNVLDREARITFKLKDGKEITLNFGLTTKNTLQRICDEICQRAEIEKIKVITSPAKSKKKSAQSEDEVKPNGKKDDEIK